jgi:peptide chain release factor 2
MPSGGLFDLAGKERRLYEIEALSGRTEFWEKPERATETLKEQTTLKGAVEKIKLAINSLEEAQIYLDLAKESGDAASLQEVEAPLAKAREGIQRLEFARMLGRPEDTKPAILSINAGAGGTEAQDWSSMLLRMYLRFCERKGWTVEETDFQEGEEAGIKSVTLRITGDYAFGFLKAEDGVHRLVRISPFDSNDRRHTSFSAVSVFPEIDDEIVVDIEDKDVRIDIFRSSGAGGQKVNKTSSAIRLTHFPTGIVVSCQNERSQHKNKDLAFKILKSRIYAVKVKEKQAVLDTVLGQKQAINFGSQIRSYVLQPYQQVKDLRTDYTTSNTAGILDGDLDEMITAYLMQEGSQAALTTGIKGSTGI